MYKTLVEYRREGVAEVVIQGAVSWVSDDEVIYEYVESEIFGRSLTKPYQMKAVARELANELSLEAKTLAIASQMAEAPQLDTLQKNFSEHELSSIATPSSMPLAPIAAITTPSPLYHPCAGKHAAIVRACEVNGWPVNGFTETTHPYHQAYMRELRKVLGSDWSPRVTAVDGCGLPTLSMSVTELAKLYAALVKTKKNDWIWQAMTSHPEILGGKNRLDTLLVRAGQGKLVAKEGADGLLGLSIEHKDFPKGLGVVIKTAHGFDPRAMQFIARAILQCLGIKISEPALDRQHAFVSSEIVPPQYRAQLLAHH